MTKRLDCVTSTKSCNLCGSQRLLDSSCGFIAVDLLARRELVLGSSGAFGWRRESVVVSHVRVVNARRHHASCGLCFATSMSNGCGCIVRNMIAAAHVRYDLLSIVLPTALAIFVVADLGLGHLRLSCSWNC